MAVGRDPRTGSGDGDLDGLGHLDLAGDGHDGGRLERRERLCRNAVGGDTALPEAVVTALDGFDRHAVAFADLDDRVSGRGGRSVVQTTQSLERREAPQLVTTAGHLEGVDVERAELLALVGGGQCRPAVLDALGGFGQVRRHPTAPSICSSMSRLSSNAYSIGSSLAMGSTKPRTTMAMASSSVMPRLIK